MLRRFQFLAAALVWVGICNGLQARTITNDELNFSLTVPDRYQSYPSTGNTIYTFATSDPSLGLPDATIAVQRLHGTIGREPMSLDSSGLPGAYFVKGRWKSFDIDVIAAHTKKNGVELAFRGAQIPLQKEAVQILVMVPVANEESADGIMSEFLTGLDGPTNWSPFTSEERLLLINQGIVRLTTVIVLVVAGIVTIVRFFRGKKPPLQNEAGAGN